MRLAVRIGALAALVAVVPLVLSGLRATQIATTEASRSSAEILVRDADALVAFVDTWVSDQAQAIAGMTRMSRLGDAPPEHLEAMTRAVYLAVPSVVTVALVDADGVPVVPPTYLSEAAPAGSAASGRRVGSAARASLLVENVPLSEALAVPGRPAIGAAYVVDPTGVPSLPVAATGPFGEPLVLAAEVLLDVVAREVAARSDHEHGVAILTDEGHPVLGADHPLVDRDALAPLLRTRAQVRFSLADGTEVRGAVTPIPRLGWAVVVVQPAEVAERAGAEIRRRTWWGVLFAAFVAIGLGVLVARNLSRPIARLRDTALAVAEGQYGRRLVLDRNDELGELVSAFNHMSGALERNRDELAAQRREIEAFNLELQARVEQRTAQLREAQAHLVRSGQLAAVAEVGAGLAHELNNPLAGILGTVQVLRARDGADDPALARIEAQAQRCREVVAAMLRLTADEGEAGGRDEVSVVDLRDVLVEVLALVRGSLRQRGVTVDLVATDAPLSVRLHRGVVRRALAPILTSLAAGLPAGARVILSPRVVGGDVVVEVIPDATVDPDRARRRDDFMASGMGLWVARRLLDSVGARLDGPDPRGAWIVVFPRSSEGT